MVVPQPNSKGFGIFPSKLWRGGFFEEKKPMEKDLAQSDLPVRRKIQKPPKNVRFMKNSIQKVILPVGGQIFTKTI